MKSAVESCLAVWRITKALTSRLIKNQNFAQLPWLSASDSVDLCWATLDKLFRFDGECLRAVKRGEESSEKIIFPSSMRSQRFKFNLKTMNKSCKNIELRLRKIQRKKNEAT